MTSSSLPLPPRRQRLSNSLGRGFSRYSRWLDSISWKRFFLVSLLALIAAGILSELPPFNMPWGQDGPAQRLPRRQEPAAQPNGVPAGDPRPLEVRVDEQGVRIGPAGSAGTPPAAPASQADSPGVRITLPEHIDADRIHRVADQIENALADKQRTRAFRPGDHLPDFMVLLIVVSMIIKLMAAGRLRAEAQAATALEQAGSESLKRQVVEARMAAMQAQVEPHFLFNTLASIDHLIETDPPRASKMQKNLIALLRASMPTLREANAQGDRDLGDELAVIRPYLEILKVRMEDRLSTDIRVDEGLLSAEFPPMMLQSLVENAIRHGLEPLPEGGCLRIGAAVEHGRLVVSVADNGCGLGGSATAGSGIGLSNIRERLQLLYGPQASLTVAGQAEGGTLATIAVPYRLREKTA